MQRGLCQGAGELWSLRKDYCLRGGGLGERTEISGRIDIVIELMQNGS